MMIMAREGEYADLLGMLEGQRTLVWTCDTCARFCNDVGGRESAERLAERLTSDGVDVAGVTSSSACCMMSKAIHMADRDRGYDVVLALCCDMGARNAAEATGKPVVNPIVTFGSGYLGRDSEPRLASVVCGRTVVDESAEDAARRNGCVMAPFV